MVRVPKKVLIACEESQAVCTEFRKLGFNAFSNDVLECSGGHPEWHIQRPLEEIINNDWDMIIAHPPCTYLSNSGVCWLTGKKAKPGRKEKMKSAAAFFSLILNHSCNHIAVENPIMHKYAVEIIGRRQDQVIHPYQFGHAERKATCLWLKGLPKLQETNNVKKQMEKLPKNKQQRLHYLPPSRDRAKLRSKTYPGIAKAMAEQWSEVLK